MKRAIVVAGTWLGLTTLGAGQEAPPRPAAGPPEVATPLEMKSLDLTVRPDAATLRTLLETAGDESAAWVPRRQAALTLGRLGTQAPEGVAVLEGVLERHREDRTDDPAGSPVVWALQGLARYGPVATRAAPAVVEVIRDGRAPVVWRLAAVEAAGRIGPGHPRVVPALLDALTADAREPVGGQLPLQQGIVETLGAVGPAAASGLPKLLRVTEREDEGLRRLAVETLGRWGPAARGGEVRVAELLLSDPSEAVRDAAVVALPSILAEPPAWLGEMLGAEEADRRRGVQLAGGFGPRAAGLLPTLRDLAAGHDPALTFDVTRAVWQITGSWPETLPLLERSMRTADVRQRREIVRWCRSLGPAIDPALPRLVALATSPDENVRTTSAACIKAIEAARTP